MKNFYFRAYTLLAFSYLFWRIGWTLNLDALVFSILFLLCEFHDVWNTNIIFKNLALYAKKKPDLIIDKDFQPSLDVFITTYDESPDLVEITIDAACNIDYPCKVFVLDDGKREQLKLLCENKNVTYLTRKDNSNAKAGNLNNAL